MDSTTEALILGFAVAFLVICGSWVSWRRASSKSLNLPPGPRALPILGSLHLLGTHPHRSLAELASQYGPVMSVWLGQRLCVVATSPLAAKEFLKFQDANFSARPPIRSADIILPEDVALHDVTRGSQHIRKILVGELMLTKQLRLSQYIRMEEMASILNRIANENGPSDVYMHLNTMTTNVISRMIFNKRFLGVEEEKASKLIKEFVEIVKEENFLFTAVRISDFFNVPKWFDPQGLEKRCQRLKSRMDRFYLNIINQYKDDQKTKPMKYGEKTLIDILLEQLDSPENGVTEESIQSIVWDLFPAGSDTTTLTSEWAMAEVLRNPRILTLATSELDRVVGLHRTVQESDIPDLKYLHAIVKETLRLHAPVPLLVPHQSKDAATVFGYDIPAKTRLFVNVWAIGRSSGSWEKPTEFVPERFLEGGENASTGFQGQHFELLPFGSGRRQCPGIGLASVAVNLQVASLLHAFEWQAGDLEMDEARPGLTLSMRKPLVATATPRLPPHLYQISNDAKSL